MVAQSCDLVEHSVLILYFQNNAHSFTQLSLCDVAHGAFISGTATGFNQITRALPWLEQ